MFDLHNIFSFMTIDGITDQPTTELSLKSLLLPLFYLFG